MIPRTGPSPAPYEDSAASENTWHGWFGVICLAIIFMALGEQLKPVAWVTAKFQHETPKVKTELLTKEDVGVVYSDWLGLATKVQNAIYAQEAQGQWCKVNMVIRFDTKARSNVDVDYLSVSCPGLARY